MYRIHPGYLAWVLEGLVAGTVHNRISVDESVQDQARVALERMLAAVPPAGPAAPAPAPAPAAGV
jgi:quinolinate synthase